MDRSAHAAAATVAIGLLGLLLAACVSAGRADVAAQTGADGFWSELREAWTRDGFVLLTKGTARVESGDRSAGFASTEAWLDAGMAEGRLDWFRDPENQGEWADQTTTFLAGDGLYEASGDSTRFIHDHQTRPAEDFARCGGQLGFVLGLFTVCEFGWEKGAAELDRGASFEGRPVVTLTLAAMFEEGPASATVQLERETLLPVAARLSFGEPEQGAFVQRYVSRWIDRGELAADWFDLSQSDYIDVEAPLSADAGVPLVWLGRGFEAPEGFPDLALVSAAAYAGGIGPGYRVELDYGTGQWPSLRLALWDPDEWQRYLETEVGAIGWSEPCAVRSLVALPDGGRAEIFAAANTPRGGCSASARLDRFLAHVYLDGVVVQINGSYCFTCFERPPGPFDSVAGLTALATALVRRP